MSQATSRERTAAAEPATASGTGAIQALVPGRARARRRTRKGFDRPRFLIVVTAATMLYLFLPIAVVIVFSFNAEHSLAVFTGFSTRWYAALMASPSIRASLAASIEIATATMVVSTALGVLLAFALVRARSRFRRPTEVTLLLNLVAPEIVGAVSLMLLFTQVGIQLSLVTVTLGHITFSIAYVAIIVRGRLATLNPQVEEAAMDLGATEFQSVRLVALPMLWPAILAAGLLVFVMSFDDFITSFFTSGAGTPPLPVLIYSMIKFGISPVINAIGTLMMIVSVCIALAALGLFAARGAARGPFGQAVGRGRRARLTAGQGVE